MPSILRLKKLEPQPDRRHHVLVFVGDDQGVDQGRDDVQVAGVRQRPGGDPAHARVAVESASCGSGP